MHMIVHKFKKNFSIHFKNSFNQSWTFRGHFLVFPVGSVWFDYVFSNFYDESFNLNRVRPLRSTQFNEVNFSTIIDPFDHQKPMLYLFKTQNHVSFIDWHTFSYRNSDFEAILRFRFFPCFPQCALSNIANNYYRAALTFFANKPIFNASTNSRCLHLRKKFLPEISKAYIFRI